MSFALYQENLPKAASLGDAELETICAAMIAAEPDGIWPHMIRGDVRLSQGQPEQAFEHYLKALAVSPPIFFVTQNAARALCALPGIDGAGATVRLGGVDELTRLLVLAHFHQCRWSLGMAADFYHRLLTLTQNAQIDELYRAALFQQEDFVRLVERFAGRVPCPGIDIFTEGNRRLLQGEIGEALRCYRQVWEQNPSFHPACFMIGAIAYHRFLTHRHNDDLSLMLSNLAEAERHNPNLPDYIFYHAMALFEVFEGMFNRPAEVMAGIMARLRRLSEIAPDYVFYRHGRPSFLASDLAIQISPLNEPDSYEVARDIYLKRQISQQALNQAPLARANLRILSEYDIGPLGHIHQLEAFVKACRLGLCPPYIGLLLVRNPYRIANKVFIEYWKQQCADHLYITMDVDEIRSLRGFAERLRPLRLQTSISPDLTSGGAANFAQQFWPQSGYLVDLPLWDLYERWSSQKRPPLLTTTPEHFEKGWQTLGQFGMRPEDWFVCLHVRESGFHGNHPHRDITGQYRDSDIDTYLPAIRSVIERGGWVVRIGDRTMKPLPPMDRVIDYALSDIKSEWMDVFLWSECRFYIGTCSGPFTIVTAFNTPRVIVNAALCASTESMCSYEVSVPKRYFDRTNGRTLSYAEQIGPQAREAGLVAQLQAGRLDYENSTPDEIADAVNQLMDHVVDNGPVVRSPLQHRFDAIARDRLTGTPLIGRHFLETHPEMF